MPKKVKLTQTIVDKLPIPEQGRVEYWCDKVAGFHVIVRNSGTKTYHFFYRVGRQSRRPKIGSVAHMSLEKARKRAKTWAGKVALGEDPAHEERLRKKSPTVSEVADEYLNKIVPQLRSGRDVTRYIEQHIVPLLGRKKVTAIDLQDAEDLHRRLEKSPTAANRCLAALSSLLTQAERWGYREPRTNPCSLVRKNSERVRHRPLTSDELERVAAACRDLEITAPVSVFAFRFLLLTGLRPEEALGLRWKDIDFDQRIINLGRTKTGQRRHLLLEPAEALLRTWKEISFYRSEPDPEDPVFHGRRYDENRRYKPITSIRNFWNKLKLLAELPDEIRLYDATRHTLGAYAGRELPSISVAAILGHRETRTTERYSSPIEEALRESGSAVTSQIASIFDVKLTDQQGFETRKKPDDKKDQTES